MVMWMLLLLTAIGCSASESHPEPAQPIESGSAEPTQSWTGSYTVETVATGLNVPWSIAELPDGQLIFTERPGRIRMLEPNGTLIPEPIYEAESPFISRGEGGLLGLTLHPDFEESGLMYVYHTYENHGVTMNRVLLLSLEGNAASLERVIAEGLPGARNHNGGRMGIGPDEKLYVTVGDIYEPERAQQPERLGGNILRLELDGSVPSDNPIPGNMIYSFGHRNPQGLAWHPETNQLYASEHGQSAHDELNRIVPGGNFGWPIAEGDEVRGGMISPLLHSGTDTWAPSGMTFLRGGPWAGQLLLANLRGEQLQRIRLSEDGTKVAEWEPLFKGQFGRIRDVFQASDGSVYVLTNNRDGRGNPSAEDDRIVRIVFTKQ